jgi:hypothetical protein
LSAPLGVGFSSLPTLAGKKAISSPAFPKAFTVWAGLVDLDTRNRWPGLLHHYVRHRNRLAGFVKFLAGVERFQERFAHVKLFGDGLARTGVVQRLQAFHIFHLCRAAFAETALHVFLGDLVVDDDGIRTGGYQSRSRFPGQAACHRPGPLASRTPSRPSGVLAELAIDLAGEKLEWSRRTCALTTAGSTCRRPATCLEFRVVDRRRIEACEAGGARQASSIKPGKQADHWQSPKQHPIKIWRVEVPRAAGTDGAA